MVSFADSSAAGKQPAEYPDPELIQVVDKNGRIYGGHLPLRGRGDSAGAPCLFGARPTESNPPCQGDLALKRSNGLSFLPTPSGVGRDVGWLTRSSDPEAGYVR